jgi:hypothetical protein
MTKDLEQTFWEKLKEGDEIYIIDVSARNSDYYSGPHKVVNPELRTLAEYGDGKMFITFTSLLFREKEIG